MMSILIYAQDVVVDDMMPLHVVVCHGLDCRWKSTLHRKVVCVAVIECCHRLLTSVVPRLAVFLANSTRASASLLARLLSLPCSALDAA